MWGCGLKCFWMLERRITRRVTPYVGVWIEILKPPFQFDKSISHPLCGGVD